MQYPVLLVLKKISAEQDKLCTTHYDAGYIMIRAILWIILVKLKAPTSC